MVSDSSLETASPASACTRLDDAIMLLRCRLEQHLDSESRLQKSYRNWQSQWVQQCAQATRNLAMLEAHLSTWMPRTPTQPQLTVVGRTADVD